MSATNITLTLIGGPTVLVEYDGLRLLTEGWKGHQDLRATVDQQGLPHLRPLVRQRESEHQRATVATDVARQRAVA